MKTVDQTIVVVAYNGKPITEHSPLTTYNYVYTCLIQHYQNFVGYDNYSVTCGTWVDIDNCLVFS